MPALNGQVSNKTIDSSSFTVLPGEYVAVVRSIEDKEYRAALPNFPSQEPDGKWNYLKILPKFELLNDQHTVIDKQDMTLGIWSGSGFLTPNPKSSPVYSGWFKGKLGGGTLLRALGLMVQQGSDTAVLRGDTTVIRDAVVRVRTAVGAYSKANEQWEPAMFLELLKKYNDGVIPPFAGWRDLLAKINAAESRTDDREIRMKNFIVDIFGVADDEVKANGWYKDEFGTVYLTRTSAAGQTGGGSTEGW